MERIVYRKTLDVHKNGVQFMLQGFETADKMSRKIEISLMASGDTIDFPLEQITAIMYVTTPGATEPSINICTIKDNTIVYDVLPITVAGITEMRLKLIETDIKGATSVLATPRFAVEVSESNVDDESATQTATFTALEDALAQAKAVYDSRLTRIELSNDCMFRAFYADGTIYETDILKELFHKGEALLSQSYARGGTGVRAGEDTDNSMYYSNVSKSASEEAQRISGEATELLTEVTKHGVYTAFYIDFETGNVEYISPSYKFTIDKGTGELEAEGEASKYDEVINHYVNEWFNDNDFSHASVKRNTENIEELQEAVNQSNENIEELQKSVNQNAENIEGLQEAVSDTGWVPLTIGGYKKDENGDDIFVCKFKNYDKDGTQIQPPKIRKVGKTVMIEGVLTPTEKISYTIEEGTGYNLGIEEILFSDIPETLRPHVPLCFLCVGSGCAEWTLVVYPDGTGYIQRYGTFEMMAIDQDTWLPFNISYIV